MGSLNIDPSLLEDLVLEHGGTLVRQDGSVFNANGDPVGYRRPARKEPKPEPVQAAPAPQALDVASLSKALVDAFGSANLNFHAPAVSVPEPQVVIQQAPKVSWRFEFERNPDKTIKAIVAKPI